VANRRGIIEHHLEPFFGCMQLNKIGPREVILPRKGSLSST
jgi:Phage integrase, N-terminal SAM-like domain